jgi:hypothetical protein
VGFFEAALADASPSCKRPLFVLLRCLVGQTFRVHSDHIMSPEDAHKSLGVISGNHRNSAYVSPTELGQGVVNRLIRVSHQRVLGSDVNGGDLGVIS